MNDNVKKHCLFCKIIAGSISSYKIYEDDLCVAFLPKKAINKGHVILCPKGHNNTYHNLSDSVISHLTLTSKKIAKTLERIFNPKKVGFSIVGFEIEHAHMHIIPLYNKHEITSSKYINVDGGGISFTDHGLLDIEENEKKSIVHSMVKDLEK